jgi:hypothetical protein
MSILSQLIGGKITLAQAVAETETWLGQVANSIEQAVQSDPAVQSAVNTLVTDGKAAVDVGAQWASTAIAGGLSAFAGEVEALVDKYVPVLAGAAGGPLSAAAVTAIQALAQVGTAAVNSEVTAVIAKTTPAPAA